MTLEVTFLNERLELFDPVYDELRAAEQGAAVRLYNRYIGPITSVTLVRPETRDLSLYSAYCHHTPVEELIRDLRVKAKPIGGPVPGGGKGAGMLRPVLGALSEMAERLLGMLHYSSMADDVWFGSYAELTASGRPARGPADIPLFAPEQYRPGFDFTPFRPETPLGWIEGTDLLSGQSVWAPAQLVLMYYRPRRDEALIGYATTAGLAFQTTPRSALLHGLFEVIERDALNIRWYSRLVPARVDVDLPAVLAAGHGVVRSRMSSPSVDLGIYELTLDSPLPVLAAIGIDRCRDERAFVGGTGAAAQPDEALAQALFELGQCQTGFHFEDPFGRNPILPDGDLDDVIEFFDAPLYYGHARNIPRLSWFCAGEERIPWSQVRGLGTADEEAMYRTMLDWLDSRGFRPVVFDFGSACPPGMSITKVYVPELTHACPPRNPMLGHPRFRRLPAALGLTGQELTFEDLNADPIPFA